MVLIKGMDRLGPTAPPRYPASLLLMEGACSGVLVFLLSWVFMGCGGNSANCNRAIAAPTLSNLGLDIQPWNSTPGSTAGAFTFDAANPDAPFIPYGANISNKTWVNIEFKPRLNAQVLSPLGGIVTAVEAQESAQEGYEIQIKTQSDSCYMVILDHVRSPTVSAGDTVTANQVLGIPGAWSAYAGQFEIQINSDSGQHCPTNYLSSTAATSVKASMTQLMTDWETLKSNTSIFNQAAMTVPGCLAD